MTCGSEPSSACASGAPTGSTPSGCCARPIAWWRAPRAPASWTRSRASSDATTQAPARARRRDDPPERGRVPDREGARPADRLRHRHRRRGLGRPGARPRARERDGLGRGEGEEPRRPRQRRALPARPHRPGAAAAHRARAALRARSRPGARDAHRQAAERPRGGRRLISGVALVAKPAGPTSHDVVDAARRALETRRIGHLGTLDPFAAGLLVLVVGRATRLAPFAAGWTKTYEGVIRLGTTTATDDASGDVVATAEGWRTLDRGQVSAGLAELRGARPQPAPPRPRPRRGRPTRLAPFAAGWTRTYEGVIRLGTTPGADDAWGDVVATAGGGRTLDRGQVSAALGELRGARLRRAPPSPAPGRGCATPRQSP